MREILFKEFNEIMEKWKGDKVKLLDTHQTFFLPETEQFQETFLLKKAIAGDLETHISSRNILIGCELNQVRIINNVQDIHMNDEENILTIHTSHHTSKKNTIVTELINTSKGGNNNG